MRKVLFTTLLGIALATTGCKKENKDAAKTEPAAAAAPVGGDTAAKAAPAGAETAPTAVAPGEPAPAGDPAAAAAADPGPRPASLTDADIALADKLVGTIEKMATAINDAGTDCPKVATAIKSMSGEMSSVAEEGKKLDERIAGDESAKKWFEATYAPKVMATMNKVMNNSCFSDEAVQKAMASVKMM
jgi:hypothetical protein